LLEISTRDIEQFNESEDLKILLIMVVPRTRSEGEERLKRTPGCKAELIENETWAIPSI